MAKKVVTLYIDDTSLRLLVTDGKWVKEWADLPLEPGLVRGAVVIKEAEVAAKVKQLFEVREVKTKNVIVGLSGLNCLTRPITLPQLPKAVLAEAIMREARRVLPVPLEQLYISWRIAPAPAGKVQVFLAAIPCKTADALLQMLHMIGLKPYLMDLKPLALARLVKETTAVIVDVQPTEFDIIIMTEGVPHPVRTMPFPTEALSWEEKLPMIRDDLSRTIEFYNSNNRGKPIDSSIPVYVSGELANEPELCQALSGELRLPVLPLPSPLKCLEGSVLSRCMVNIGLALKGLVSGKKAGSSVANINVLPSAYRPKPTSLAKLIALPGTAAIIGLLVPLVMLVQGASASVVSMRTHLDITNQLLRQKELQRQALTTDIAELKKKLAEVESSHYAFTAVLNSLDKQTKVINGDLYLAISVLPSTISLSSINHTSSILTISGNSPSEAEILSYARSLNASGMFSEIIIARAKRIEDRGINFTLVLKM